MIKTERLTLRPAQLDDAAALFEVYGDAKAMQFWDSLPHANVAQTQEFVAHLVQSAAQTRYFVIEHQARAIGTGGFWRASEVGYILRPDLWEQGLGAEVLNALITEGFGPYGFDHITAEVDPQNAASIAMLTRAGFRETGRAENTLELGGKWFDSVYFELRKPT